jgi:hypothetical protein
LGRAPLITAATFRFPQGGGEIIVNIMDHTTTRTLAQAEASRLNGAKGQGPVTAAGRLSSSANTVVHGLATRAALLPGEDIDLDLAGDEADLVSIQSTDPFAKKNQAS